VPSSIRIPTEILDALLTHARTNSPIESCGLLAGRNSTITNFYSTANSSPTPTTNYEIPPQDLFRIMRELRNANLDLLAIYHSHPTSENAPSPTDIARAYYPETAYIIVSPQAAARNPIRAYQIREAQVTELAIESP
jgi:[CysO sulfur-carrier protein]-S-L-cysteine hydrolase